MNLKPFLAWCSSHRIRTPLEICIRPDGSRYTALSPNSERQLSDENIQLVQCPLDACIRAPTGEELADRLIYETLLGEESKYAPYLATLPAAFPDMPRFWSPERLELVTDGGFLERAMKEMRVGGDAWALACVDSRANFLPDGSFALTPVLDMINHDGLIQTTAAVKEDIFSLEVHLIHTKRPADEVCISYGKFTNLQTILNYGFVQPSNPHNREFVQINVMGHPPVIAELSCHGDLDIVSLGTLRTYLAMNEDEISSGPIVPFLSERNELNVQSLIACFVEEALDEAKAGSCSTSDPLVSTYLKERAVTLQTTMSKIEATFPHAFG